MTDFFLQPAAELIDKLLSNRLDKNILLTKDAEGFMTIYLVDKAANIQKQPVEVVYLGSVSS